MLAVLAVSCGESPSHPTPIPSPTPTPVVRSTGPLAFTSNRDGRDAIYLANADGSGATRLTDGIAPAWSPDGRQIAFQLNRTVHVINTDGSALRVVTLGDDPAWSPDGGRLVFSSEKGIAVIDATGSNRRELFDDRTWGAFEPAWSPDGHRIAFSVGTYSYYRDEDDFNGLWTMNADGLEARRLLELTRDTGQPAWSPDGSEFAFVSDVGIGVARADGSGKRMVVSASNVIGVEWTEDGRLIYGRGDSGPLRIFINASGLERQLVPDGASVGANYRDYLPSWSRSGR